MANRSPGCTSEGMLANHVPSMMLPTKPINSDAAWSA